MGHKAGPEILQIIASAIAVVTTVVRPLWAAPPLVRTDVWIDNIRIAGSKSGVTLWEAQLLRNADSCRATMGRTANRAPRSTPFWGRNLITLQAMPLSERLSAVYAPCRHSILQPSREKEFMAPRFFYAAAIFGTRLCDCCFFIKTVRRRLSALNRGIVLETSTANLPPSTVGFGRETATQQK
ncbi:target of rapamycin (TOR) kinase 1 [Trypanosoma cruzi]|nr:target of rapamycin (TOR) kinase 1 [Trypanosoma cruzi]